MKKILKLTLALTLILTFTLPNEQVNAQKLSFHYTEKLSDGYYADIELSTSAVARSNSKSATKTYNIRNSSDKIVAIFKLTAVFSYPTGNTATCQSVTYSTSIIDSDWSFSDCYKINSGNTATGHFIAKCSPLGITLSTIERTVTITCDQYGNVS